MAEPETGAERPPAPSRLMPAALAGAVLLAVAGGVLACGASSLTPA